MRRSKAVVFIEHYRTYVCIFRAIGAILPRKSFRQRYGKMVERGYCMLRETKGRVFDQTEDVQRPRDVHRKMKDGR